MNSPTDMHSLTTSEATLTYTMCAMLELYTYYFSNYTVTCSCLVGLVAHGLETIKEALL